MSLSSMVEVTFLRLDGWGGWVNLGLGVFRRVVCGGFKVLVRH